MIFLFELIPLKCIYLHRGYFGLIKNTKVGEYSLQIIKIGERFLLVKQLCLAFFERNPYFFYLFLFFCAFIFFASAFARCIYGTACQRKCAKW